MCHAVLFPECVTKGSRFLGVWGLDRCSPPVGRRDVFRDVFASFFASFSRRKFRVYEESCKTSVSASPLASPCLWGKLPNLVLASPCLWGKLQTVVSACPLASPCLWGKLPKNGGFDALSSPCLWGKILVTGSWEAILPSYK